MIQLSVRVNHLFEDGTPNGEMVRRSAAAGADAIGYWPWFDDDLGEVVDVAEEAGVDIA